MTVPSLEHFLVLADDIDGTRDFYCEWRVWSEPAWTRS
jgi:hypothetical protein